MFYRFVVYFKDIKGRVEVERSILIVLWLLLLEIKMLVFVEWDD